MTTSDGWHGCIFWMLMIKRTKSRSRWWWWSTRCMSCSIDGWQLGAVILWRRADSIVIAWRQSRLACSKRLGIHSRRRVMHARADVVCGKEEDVEYRWADRKLDMRQLYNNVLATIESLAKCCWWKMMKYVVYDDLMARTLGNKDFQDKRKRTELCKFVLNEREKVETGVRGRVVVHGQVPDIVFKVVSSKPLFSLKILGTSLP